MSFIGEADGPDPHDAARAIEDLEGKQPRRLQHGDKVRRRIKFGQRVPYNWIILQIYGLNSRQDGVLCEVQIDLKGTRSLK